MLTYLNTLSICTYLYCPLRTCLNDMHRILGWHSWHTHIRKRNWIRDHSVIAFACCRNQRQWRVLSCFAYFALYELSHELYEFGLNYRLSIQEMFQHCRLKLTYAWRSVTDSVGQFYVWFQTRWILNEHQAIQPLRCQNCQESIFSLAGPSEMMRHWS
jgi:hypothetical protein